RARRAGGAPPRREPRRPGPRPREAEDLRPPLQAPARAQRGRLVVRPAPWSARQAPPRAPRRGRSAPRAPPLAGALPRPRAALALRAPARQTPVPAGRALSSILRRAPATLPARPRRRAKPASATMGFGGVPERSNGAVLKTAGG